jgi:hypothetical protein
MSSVIPAITANIRDHLVLKFSNQMQGVMKQAGLDATMAAQTVLKVNTAMAQQGLDQDPKVLLAKAEQQNAANEQAKIFLKAAELQQKADKDAADLAVTLRGQDLSAKNDVNSMHLDVDVVKFKEALALVKQVIGHGVDLHMQDQEHANQPPPVQG